MDNQSILVFTFGETAYRLGTQIKEKNPRGFIVTSFMHPKENLKGQCVVTNDKDDFGVAFDSCLAQNEPPLSRLALAWRWLMRKPRKTERKLVIVAGLGGKYSSEYAPIAAQIAHGRGYQVMAVVQLPFRFEGQKRCPTFAHPLPAFSHTVRTGGTRCGWRIGNLFPHKSAKIHTCFPMKIVAINRFVPHKNVDV